MKYQRSVASAVDTEVERRGWSKGFNKKDEESLQKKEKEKISEHIISLLPNLIWISFSKRLKVSLY